MSPEDLAPMPGAFGEAVISVSHVSKTYRLYRSHRDRLKELLNPFRKRYHEEFLALDDISLEIRRGTSVGILGRNGAGKSTLLQLIAGVIHPSSGKLRVAGNVAALLELGAGFNPDLTGRENVLLANAIQGTDDGDLCERVALVEAFADIGDFFDQPVKFYSSGMYARIAFSHAIHVNPDVLILDEILGVGDARFQEKCYHRINTLRDSGVSILFVSHSTEIIQRNCEQAILLEAGKLLSYGAVDETASAYRDLLYGARTFVGNGPGHSEEIRAAQSQSARGPKPSDEAPSVLFDEHEGGGMQRRYHNSYERRIGNRAAEIVDIVMTADGRSDFGVLTGNERINLYLKVRFDRLCTAPQIGWALVTTEGLVIAGSNTVMQRSGLPPAEAGEVVVYNQEIALALCGGQYFITLGVGEYENHEWTYFDLRNSVIHIEVEDAGRASGFLRVFASCREMTNRINHDPATQ